MTTPYARGPRRDSRRRSHMPHLTVDAHGSGPEGTGTRAQGQGFATRPVLQGTLGMVAAGHYLASAIGLRLLEQGGNAVDAGIAEGLALAVLEPQSNVIGGEVAVVSH